MSAEDQKAANENDDAGQRGPTRRQFLAGMAAAGARFGCYHVGDRRSGFARLPAQRGRSSPCRARVSARGAG